MIYVKKNNNSKYYLNNRIKEKTISILTFTLIKYNVGKQINNEKLKTIEGFKKENNFDVLNLLIPIKTPKKNIWLCGTRLGKNGTSKHFLIIEIDNFKLSKNNYFTFQSKKKDFIVNWLYPDKYYQFKESCNILHLIELFKTNWIQWKDLKFYSLIKKLPFKNPIELITNKIFIQNFLNGFKENNNEIVKSVKAYSLLICNNPSLKNQINKLKLYLKFEKFFGNINYTFSNKLSYKSGSNDVKFIEKRFRFFKKIVNTMNKKRTFYINDEVDDVQNKWLNSDLFKRFDPKNEIYYCMAMGIFNKNVILLNIKSNVLMKFNLQGNFKKITNEIDFLNLL